MHMKMCIHYLLLKRLASYKVCLCFIVSKDLLLYRMVVNFVGIKFSQVSLSFLSMIIITVPGF